MQPPRWTERNSEDGNDGPVPQPDGRLQPPNRKPPTAVAVATPQPPSEPSRRTRYGVGLTHVRRAAKAALGTFSYPQRRSSHVYTLRPIGRVSSPLTDPSLAPKQANEGGVSAWLDFVPDVTPALRDLTPGDEVLVLTWLHRANRGTLEVHPRDDPAAPLHGVFSTRSADRPNPIGIHRVTIVEVASPTRVRVDALEAVDQTPIIDLKPVLDRRLER